MILTQSRTLLDKLVSTIPGIGLIVSAFFCIVFTVYLDHNTALNFPHASFIGILIAALMMWIFRLVPEYIPAFIILLAAASLHIAPQEVILSGFNSNSFFIAVSVFAVGASITKSRLFYRLSLMLLIYLPSKQSLLQKFLFLFGALITPIMSVQSSRVALMAPLLDDILESSTIHPRSSTANALANAAFNGCILLSTIFLTGKSSNFIVFGVLSEQNQWQGNWLHWLWAASFPGLLLVILFFIMQSILFKSKATVHMNQIKLRKELRALGVLTSEECIALICLVLFGLGSLFSNWKGISTVWICCTLFTVLLSSKTLTIKELRSKINWNFLFYFGAIIGIMHILQHTGFESWVLTHFQWLSYLAALNPLYFIIIVYAMSWLVALFLGTMIAPTFLLSLLIPIANQSAINNWIVAFVILMATEAWVFPYQSSYFLCFEEMLKTNNNFHLNPLLKLNAWFSLFKLVILIASIPFWQFFKLLN